MDLTPVSLVECQASQTDKIMVCPPTQIPRRDFLKQISIVTAATASTSVWPPFKKKEFPYVDGLCFLDTAEHISASGLSGMIADVSAGELIELSDGSRKYERTFTACSRSIVSARQYLRTLETVFLATEGSQLYSAFENGQTAVFFQIQGGGEAVGEDLTRIDLFRELGLRVLQITHHHDNPLGCGALEKNPTGLTSLGFEAVERLNTVGIIPDVSHASDQTALDVIKTSNKPVILSHGAARALVNNARCAPDNVIRGIADSGGVMGIFMMSFWLTSDPNPTIDSLLSQIRHVINVGGIESVGIANDFPLTGEAGLTKANNDNSKAVENYFPWWDSIAKREVLGFDKRPAHVAIPELNTIRRMFTIHEALEQAGFMDGDIEKIMGGNFIRVLSAS